MAPLTAQACNGDPRLIHQANATQMTPACWATNFGFLSFNCKPDPCTDVHGRARTPAGRVTYSRRRLGLFVSATLVKALEILDGAVMACYKDSAKERSFV
jgi:hypothetical protein